MEAGREIYWNVGHGVIWPMYLFSIVAFGFLIWGFRRRVTVYRLGKPLNRLDQLPRRISLMARDTLAQWRVVSIPRTGILHAIFFWSFLILFIGTLMIMFQTDFTQPLLGRVFLKGSFYRAYSLALDVAGCALFVVLVAFLLRRWSETREAVETLRGELAVPGVILAAVVTGFLVEALRMAATELPNDPALAHFSPVGMLLGRGLVRFGAAKLAVAHKLLWWVHFCLVLVFIAALPFTRMRHIFTTAASNLFSDLRPPGSINSLDLENEAIEQFGAAGVTELTWKDIFDADACMTCASCQDCCPAWTTGKPLSPMRLVQQIGETAFADHGGNLIKTITEDVLWSCTTCFACQAICPANVEHVNKIIEMRRNLSLMEAAFPGPEVRTAVLNIEDTGNPFGMLFPAGGDWADGLPVVRMDRDSDVDFLYFVGCYALFDRRNQEVAKSFVRICAAAGLRVGVLGEEQCCGEPARKLGNEYLYQTLAHNNMELLRSYGVRKIVTTCPHCFNALSRDYGELGFCVPVEHHTTFLHRLVTSQALKLAPNEFDCTYHDSCYIGRYKNIYIEPRDLLRVAGGHIDEMSKCKNESFCCGAGGGRVFAEEKLGRRISAERVTMALETSAPLLVLNCPFCLTMCEDAIKTADLESRLQARDLAEVLAERIVR